MENISQYVLPILFLLLFGCKGPQNYRIAEVGGVNLKEFKFGLTDKNENLKPSVFKVCLLPGIYDCATSFVISSEQGILISAGHLFVGEGSDHKSMSKEQKKQAGKRVLVRV